MKIASKNYPVQSLISKIKRGNILLKHKLQRREGAWSHAQKSLLIDSLLRGYLVNPTYTVIENKQQATIDGVQRFSTLRDYLADGFALSRSLKPISINGEVYEIAGKRFSKLDEIVRDELLTAQIQIYEITDYTDEDIREMFRRLNSGKALNNIQKLTPDMSDDLGDAVYNIASHSFFEKVLTPAQLVSAVDLSIALEVLMLSEVSDEYGFGSFRKADKEKFVQYYNDKVNTEKLDLIIQALDKLDEAFDEGVSIPKTSISLCVYGMYRIIKDNKSVEKYIHILKEFLENYSGNEEYGKFTHNGTASAENVRGRLNFFRDMIRKI